jgi:hypothetical protein
VETGVVVKHRKLVGQVAVVLTLKQVQVELADKEMLAVMVLLVMAQVAAGQGL